MIGLGPPLAFFVLSPMEILVVVAIALLIFGPSKLADLGKGLGEGIRNFKSAVNDSSKNDDAGKNNNPEKK